MIKGTACERKDEVLLKVSLSFHLYFFLGDRCWSNLGSAVSILTWSFVRGPLGQGRSEA